MFDFANVGFTGLFSGGVAPAGLLRDPDFLLPTGTAWRSTSTGFSIATPGKATGDGTSNPFLFQRQQDFLIPMTPGNYIALFFLSRFVSGQLRTVCNFPGSFDQYYTPRLGLQELPFAYSAGDYTFNFQGFNFNGDIEWAQIVPA